MGQSPFPELFLSQQCLGWDYCQIISFGHIAKSYQINQQMLVITLALPGAVTRLNEC